MRGLKDVRGLAIAAVVSAVSAIGAPPAEPPPALPSGSSVPAAEVTPALATCTANWSSRVVEMEGHRRAPVVTAWLSNGVCVHHMKKDMPPGQVVVMINLVGSELLESSESRGISMAAAEAWKRRAIRDMSAEQVSRVLSDRDIHIEAAAMADAMQLRVWGSREDMETGMRVVAELLTRPRVEQADIDRAADEAERLRDARETTEQGRLRTAVAAAILPPEQSDPRMGLPDPARLRGLKPDSVQKWLDWHIESAPVEAAIVGDISLEQAMRLAAGYLGQMPKRDRISSRSLAESRKLVPAPLPVSIRLDSRTKTGSTLVVVGFLGGDASRPSELRALRAAARVLTVRAQSALANGGVENTGVGASVVPAVAYPGFGAVFVSARVAAADAERAADKIAGVIRMSADTGVARPEKPGETGAERDTAFEVARTELASVVRGFEQDQRYWAGILSRSITQGADPDELADGETFYKGLDPAAVNAALKRNATVERMFRVVIGG